jgi:hypothetical protein
MFRLSPSRIALEDIAPTDCSNRINPSEAIAASQALNRALESPVFATQTAAVQQPVSNSSAVMPVLFPAIDLGPATNKMTTIPSTYHAPTTSHSPMLTSPAVLSAKSPSPKTSTQPHRSPKRAIHWRTLQHPPPKQDQPLASGTRRRW